MPLVSQRVARSADASISGLQSRALGRHVCLDGMAPPRELPGFVYDPVTDRYYKQQSSAAADARLSSGTRPQDAVGARVDTRRPPRARKRPRVAAAPVGSPSAEPRRWSVHRWLVRRETRAAARWDGAQLDSLVAVMEVERTLDLTPTVRPSPSNPGWLSNLALSFDPVDRVLCCVGSGHDYSKTYADTGRSYRRFTTAVSDMVAGPGIFAVHETDPRPRVALYQGSPYGEEGGKVWQVEEVWQLALAVATTPGNTEDVRHIRIAVAQPSRLLCVSVHPHGITVRPYDELRSFPSSSDVLSVDLSTSGRFAACGLRNGWVRALDVGDFPRTTHDAREKGAVVGVSLADGPSSPWRGRWAAAGGRVASSFEAKYWTGRVDSAACSVRFVPDDGPSNAMPTRVVVGSMDGAITLFDTRMFGHLCRLRRPLPRGELFSFRMSVSDCGRMLAAGDTGGGLTLWSAATGHTLRRMPLPVPSHLAGPASAMPVPLPVSTPATAFTAALTPPSPTFFVGNGGLVWAVGVPSSRGPWGVISSWYG